MYNDDRQRSLLEGPVRQILGQARPRTDALFYIVYTPTQRLDGWINEDKLAKAKTDYGNVIVIVCRQGINLTPLYDLSGQFPGMEAIEMHIHKGNVVLPGKSARDVIAGATGSSSLWPGTSLQRSSAISSGHQ